MGAAAITAGLVGYGELTKPRPVASGTFEAIPANEAPDWRDEASVDEIQWSKLKWSGDFDLPVYELFQLETRSATCLLIAEDGTIRGQSCAPPGQVMSFRTREGDGESAFGDDFPVRLIVKDGQLTAWDDVPRDTEEYR